MAVEEIAKLSIERESGWFYFLRGGSVLRTKERDGIDTTRVRGEIVRKSGFAMEDGFVYWLDGEGDIARATIDEVDLLDCEDRVKEARALGIWQPLAAPLAAPPFRLEPGREHRVLSVHGPWAWSIIYAGKDIENRSWSTPHRGTILIH